MGIPKDSPWVGIILTFFDVKKGPYPALPSPPNKSWYLPWAGPFGFSLTTPVWSMSFIIADYAPYYGCGMYGCKLNIPNTWVFDQIVYPGGPDDLYRAENFITYPLEGYYGGYATVLPVTDPDMPELLSTVVSEIRLDGPDRVFAEQMGAAGQKRGIRLARVADHSCCYFALKPVTNVL